MGQPDLDTARASIREAAMLTIGSLEKHEVEAIRGLLQTAINALEGELSDEDAERAALPLQRGYGKAGDKRLFFEEEFSGEFKDEG